MSNENKAQLDTVQLMDVPEVCRLASLYIESRDKMTAEERDAILKVIQISSAISMIIKSSVAG